jgi:putative methionine-R-sulfoxide reductase with GAF domain
MYGSAQPETPCPGQEAADSALPADPALSIGKSSGGQFLGEQELDAALQLLVERAQYLTGATGVALALPSGEEMVCRASAGASAPPVGARLQVRSGLTGESIARRQLLRSDNAENDPRVNLETCHQLGIASIVVLPLLRNGDICGLFELFSDHAYAFEESDLAALDRIASVTLTALGLAARGPGYFSPFVPDSIASAHGTPSQASTEISDRATAGPPTAEVEQRIDSKQGLIPAQESDRSPALENLQTALPPAPSSSSQSMADGLLASQGEVQDVPVPEAMARVQKCAGCGFPVSDGRMYCLDCEKKEGKLSASSEPVAVEFVPSFLTSSTAPEESWLANHVNLLAIIVLIVGILVAIVVFR